MTLTPEDIQTKQFHVRFRGFDVEEVDAFLEKVAEELLAALEENKMLTEKVEEMSKEMATYHSQEKAFQNAILSAQNIADEMKEKSRQEAEEIVRAAREEADDLRQEANGEITRLEKELDRLTGLKSQIQEDLRAMLQSYLAQVEGEPEEAPVVFRAAVEPEPDRGDLAAQPESGTPEEPPAPSGASETAAQADDLSDLYEKIDLMDDALPGMDREESAASEGEDEKTGRDDEVDVGGLLNVAAEDDDESQALPDLEGDMVFTLEDPLDDEDEPAVDFSNEEEKSSK